uniref:BTB domain-containing protein n=1 Tax=Ciona savignyi TaxID=51511 RepID=H2ZG50_CIOSA
MVPTKNLERMLFAISNMRRNGQFCDVEIVAHCGEIFQAHSCILATASSCLQNMIQKGCYDPQKRVTKVFLPESIPASSFSSLLDLIYSCNVNVKLSKQLRQTHLVRLDELFSSEDANLENSAKELDILLSEHARKRFKTKKSMSHTEQAGEVTEEKTLTVALSSPRRSK